MLLHSCKITRILPCIADPEKIRVMAEISDEIHEVFPYLNAVIKGCIYNHPALTLTIRNEEKLITLHANHVTMTLIEDEKEAYEVLNWLKDLINETYQKKDQIEPNYSDGGQLKPSDIQKLLPGTNCRECGFRSCLAFAFKLVDEKIEIVKCTPLFSDQFKEKRKVLLETLQNAGLKVPSEFLESEKSQRKGLSWIGLDIGGETPEEIAISIAAEIISAKKGKLEALKKKGVMQNVTE